MADALLGGASEKRSLVVMGANYLDTSAAFIRLLAEERCAIILFLDESMSSQLCAGHLCKLQNAYGTYPIDICSAKCVPRLKKLFHDEPDAAAATRQTSTPAARHESMVAAGAAAVVKMSVGARVELSRAPDCTRPLAVKMQFE